MMEGWLKFLQSLETDGGRMFTAIFLVLFICIAAIYMHVSGHDPKEVGTEVMRGIVMSLMGIIYVFLRPGGKPPTT